jgi:hypothetical protein
MSWSDQDIDQLFKGAKAPEPPKFREEFWTEMEAMLPGDSAPLGDEDVDRLFRDAIAPAPPAFEESYWMEMEAMLPAQKNRRRVLLWWFSGAAVVTALLGIAGSWFYGDHESYTRPVTPASTQRTNAASQQADKSAEHRTHTHSFSGVPAQQHAAAQDEALLNDGVRVENNTVNTFNSERSGASAVTDPANFTAPLPDVAASAPGEPKEIGTLQAVPFSDGSARFLVSRTCPVVNTKAVAERFYVQVAAGIGQSSQRDVSNASGMLHYYAIGAGLFKRADNIVLTFGVNARVDFTQNVIGSTGPGEPDRTETKYSELYSVETPASLGFCAGRNTWSFTVTPGFQAGFTGEEHDFEDNIRVRAERTSGKVANGRTLTMEIGFGYWRTLQPNWYLGASVNADALRPFNPSNFAGDPRLLPLNGQVTLRRTF